MIYILDNTVLSNFALINRAELLKEISDGTMVTTAEVLAEFQIGVVSGDVPHTTWDWLPVLSLSKSEQISCKQFLGKINLGEVSCLAVAFHRHGQVFTDDHDARKLAQRLSLPVSGTLGVLIRLIEAKKVTVAFAVNKYKR